MIQCASLGIPKEMENAISISIAFCLDFFITNENITSEECRQMNVLFLTTLPTLKACNSPYMQKYLKRFSVLHSSEVIFSFLIKKSRHKAIEIETALFHSLVNPKRCTLDDSFYASHIRHNFPHKMIPISMS